MSFKASLFFVYIPYQKIGMALISISGKKMTPWQLLLPGFFHFWLGNRLFNTLVALLCHKRANQKCTHGAVLMDNMFQKSQDMQEKYKIYQLYFPVPFRKKTAFLVAFFHIFFCIFNSGTGGLLWLVRTFQL